jgi:hypothetical protein
MSLRGANGGTPRWLSYCGPRQAVRRRASHRFIVEDTPEGRAAGLRLIDRAFAHLRSLPLDLLGTLSLPHTLEYRLLREKGFWPCPKRLEPQPFRLVARPYDEPGRLATKLRNWFVTMGDYDAV